MRVCCNAWSKVCQEYKAVFLDKRLIKYGNLHVKSLHFTGGVGVWEDLVPPLTF